MDEGNLKGTESGKLGLFISYSRADINFADELVKGLEYDGNFRIAIDRHSIIEGEDCKKRLGALIADSDTIVFLLSPASAKSAICTWEVDEAVRLSKRIVPILLQSLGGQAAPAALAALNYVRFDPFDDGKPRSFMDGLKGLVRALKSDVGWLREHTRLLARASEWNEARRPANRLLTGEAVAEAKTWAARLPKDAPALTTSHLEFITASEQGEITRQGEAAQAFEERERLLRQAEQSAREREVAALLAQAAVEREREAMRASARMQRIAMSLLIAVFAGLLGWTNQAVLAEQWNWYWVMRPYMIASVRPHVLSAEKEQSLMAGETFRECARDCPEMVVVPAGKFMMGSPNKEDKRQSDEGPQQEIQIARPYAVSKFPVTFADWDRCWSVGGCPPLSDSGFGRDKKPVINVSWHEAKRYVAWLSFMTGQQYRLLSESEWEYAARARSMTAYVWVEQFVRGSANCKDCGSKWDNQETSPVGSFASNAFGLYDMQGNVFHWLEDCYQDNLSEIPSDGAARTSSGDCNRRVGRGGSWDYFSDNLRSAYRGKGNVGIRNSRIEIRVARTLLTPPNG